jgi:hypothetical protein
MLEYLRGNNMIDSFTENDAANFIRELGFKIVRFDREDNYTLARCIRNGHNYTFRIGENGGVFFVNNSPFSLTSADSMV